MTSSDSRFQVLNVPLLAPGHCFSCRSSDSSDRSYIDFSLQFDWYGAIYFCTKCISELAGAIGWIESSDNDFVQNLLKNSIEECENLSNRVKEIESAARTILRDCSCWDPDSIGYLPLDDSSNPGESEEDDSGSEE